MVEVNMLVETHLHVNGKDTDHCIHLSAVPRKGETMKLTAGGFNAELVVVDVVWQVFATDESPGQGHYVELMLEEAPKPKGFDLKMAVAYEKASGNLVSFLKHSGGAIVLDGEGKVVAEYTDAVAETYLAAVIDDE